MSRDALALLAVLGVLVADLTASPAAQAADDHDLCGSVIAQAERSHGIPAGLLLAVGVVESGRPAPDGALQPWPWTLNVNGKGRYFQSAAAAHLGLEAALAAGETNIDVGCMQINMRSHPDAFPSTWVALDPGANVGYAARFLARLHDETGSWSQAASYYHSRTPRLAEAYSRRVSVAWGSVARDGPVPGPAALSMSLSAARPLGSAYQASPLPTSRGFDAAAVLDGLRETRRVQAIVRDAARHARAPGAAGK